MKTYNRIALAALSTILAVAGDCSWAAEAPKAGTSKVTLAHIFVIVLENHSRDSVIGSPYMPRVTALAKAHGQANKYYGVTHPSQPNYIAMLGGDTFGITNDRAIRPPLDKKNLIDQLEPHHTWAAYMESAPQPGYLEDTYPPKVNLYVSKHNPFVSFDDIRGKPSRLEKIKPYAQFAADMASPGVPDFVYVVPNQCHDMHGGVEARIGTDDGTPCPFSSTADDDNDKSLKQKADDFVGNAVATIMASKAWATGDSAIFIVADESDYEQEDSATGGWKDVSGCCDSPVVAAGSPTINLKWRGGVYGGGLSPAIVITTHGGPVVSAKPYNHYSLLTTIEDNWGLGYLGHAGDSAGGVLPMNDLLER
jgi:hypothetical protein